jgi:hypothetical protein
LTVRVTGTDVVGVLECTLDANAVIRTKRHGRLSVPANIVDVVPFSPDADAEAKSLADARRREFGG